MPRLPRLHHHSLSSVAVLQCNDDPTDKSIPRDLRVGKLPDIETMLQVRRRLLLNLTAFPRDCNVNGGTAQFTLSHFYFVCLVFKTTLLLNPL